MLQSVSGPVWVHVETLWARFFNLLELHRVQQYCRRSFAMAVQLNATYWDNQRQCWSPICFCERALISLKTGRNCTHFLDVIPPPALEKDVERFSCHRERQTFIDQAGVFPYYHGHRVKSAPLFMGLRRYICSAGSFEPRPLEGLWQPGGAFASMRLFLSAPGSSFCYDLLFRGLQWQQNQTQPRHLQLDLE